MNNTDLSGGTGSLGGIPQYNPETGNLEKRKRKQMLVTSADEYMTSEDAMKEIMARKRARGAQFREMKMADYRDRCGLTFAECEEHNFADAEYRRKIKDGEMKGGFAGEGESFPIASPEDVRNAWMSIGRTKQDPEKIKKNILRLAKKYNWTSGLPKSVRKEHNL